MSDPMPPPLPSGPPAELVRKHPPLPRWLTRKLLRGDEEITWVRGPRLQPWWELFVTHPLLFVAALAVGAVCVGAGYLATGSWKDTPPACYLVALGLFFGSIYVLAIFSAYFTRLVVTNLRLFIVQGREVCRSWSLDRLPRSLRRYRVQEGVGETWTVDVATLQTMIGGSDQFADSKTLMSFGKQLEQIRAREEGRR